MPQQGTDPLTSLIVGTSFSIRKQTLQFGKRQVSKLSFSGKLFDYTTSETTKAMIVAEIGEGQLDFILDLEKLVGIPDNNFGPLQVLFDHVRENGGKLIIYKPQASIATRLRQVRLDQRFPTLDHSDDIVAFFQT